MTPLVTFTSDFGNQDEYSALIKAMLYRITSNLKIVELNHNIPPFNIQEGARFLRTVYSQFPKKSIHLGLIHSDYQQNPRFLAVFSKDQWLVIPDNGLLSLIEPNLETAHTTEEGTLESILTYLLQETEPLKKLQDIAFTRYLNPTLRANKKMINGVVTHIDHYGNIITNIDRHTFEVLCEGKSFTIRFGHESLSQVHHSYSQVDPGECYALINSQGYLQLGINLGKGNTLLGLNADSPVTIQIGEN